MPMAYARKPCLAVTSFRDEQVCWFTRLICIPINQVRILLFLNEKISKFGYSNIKLRHLVGVKMAKIKKLPIVVLVLV